MTYRSGTFSVCRFDYILHTELTYTRWIIFIYLYIEMLHNNILAERVVYMNIVSKTAKVYSLIRKIYLK